MFVAIALSALIKYITGGTTPLEVFFFALMIVGVTQVFRTWAAAYLSGAESTRTVCAETLVTSGPYAFVRNPLYLGNLIIGLALCTMVFEWYAFLIFSLSYLFVYSIVIPYEERFLETRFGEEYLHYKRKVWRLIPSIHRYRSNRKTIPDWIAGIKAEAHIPIILVLISLFLFLTFAL